MTPSVYLDHNATTPLDPRVLEVMMPFLTEAFGNPSSTTHAWGRAAREAVETARGQVASLIEAQPGEICFTSGATESNNLAIKGVLRLAAQGGSRGHVVTSTIEHPSVLKTVEALEREGFTADRVAPDAQGRIRVESVRAAIGHSTILVSIIGANGEIGTLQPIAALGSACREAGVLFHTDATQVVGKLPVDVTRDAIDLLSLSSHKLYGPKGVGALFVRRGVRLEPLISGGGQEHGLRSGTLNVPGIVGLGAVAELRQREMEEESRRLRGLSDALLEGLRARIPDLHLNGHPEERLPGTLNVAIPRVPSERLMLTVKEFAFSASSACHSGSGSVSPILSAIGLDADLAGCSVRFGLGKSTTLEQVEQLCEAVERAARRIRGPVAGPSTARAL